MREPDVLPHGSGGASSVWWGSQEPRGRPPSRDRRGRPLIAALLSCLLPGAGQLYLGYRRRGAVMLVVTVLCLAVAVGLWSEPTALSRMLVQPRSLLALLVADAGLLVFRIVAVLDAYLLASRDGDRAPVASGWRKGAAVGLVALLTLTAAPHAAAAYYDLQAYDLLTSVFAGEDPAVARPGPRPPPDGQRAGHGHPRPGHGAAAGRRRRAGPARPAHRHDDGGQLRAGHRQGVAVRAAPQPGPGAAARRAGGRLLRRVPLLPAAAQRALRLRRGRAARPVPQQPPAGHRRRRRGGRGAARAAHRPLRPGRPARVRGRGRRPRRGHRQQPQAPARRDRPPRPRGRPAGLRGPARAQAASTASPPSPTPGPGRRPATTTACSASAA